MIAEITCVYRGFSRLLMLLFVLRGQAVMLAVPSQARRAAARGRCM